MAHRLTKPLRLLLLGAPGSGKGTQTSKLLKFYPELYSLSSGDIFRQQIAAKTKLGLEASKYIENGSLVPDNIVTGLVVDHLTKEVILPDIKHWILDGFPRNIEQAKSLDTSLAHTIAGNNNKCVFNLVVELDVPQQIIIDRIVNRWVHIPSGRVYNLQYNPPKVPGKDDITGEPLSKRPDDTEEIVSKRLKDFNLLVKPLKEYYQNLGILKVVSGETSDIIFPKLLDIIKKNF
ncbi:related to Adenylate kinase 2 [Saccharomycodes ludwigii]|uniref:GTP:AMP phosphotransferase, mitochondrial n=1 Tax=Saccharomycodes ludwigii TaxID=36035 RepID=A0A376B1N3_9ASCO|nr:hypothetical protein SCDLUD_001672 [Saccharomycodes ludwigii]KAH3901888.1 hypothetical protein SCDLUD_001672 [Saccharomycodes ludwigii]SSD58573.1 related to Adenylate kinase 2 [Saccharomycodes ludwigii]